MVEWRIMGAAIAGAAFLVAACPYIARAGERIVQLRTPPPLRSELAAIPVIADPANDAERRINAALRRLDIAGQKAASECRTAAGRPGTWRRTVDVPMHGPGYLSLVIRDDSFCDGAHPSSDLQAIVYDLSTGSPVDWSQLLPAGLTGRLTLQMGSDGTRMVVLASPRLHALYLAGYHAASVPEEDRADCREAVAMSGNDGPPAMMAWLDATADGLAIYRSLPNVVQACAEIVVIPADGLRRELADPGMIARIEIAHATR